MNIIQKMEILSTIKYLLSNIAEDAEDHEEYNECKKILKLIVKSISVLKDKSIGVNA